MAAPTMQTADTNMQRCIQECLNCHRICLETASYAATTGNIEHILTLLDCAEICQTSANFMIRGSDLHIHTCEACAAICEACADVCEQMSNDAQFSACAASCRRCAQSCDTMTTA